MLLAVLGGSLFWIWSLYDELTHKGVAYPLGAPPSYETLRKLSPFASYALYLLAVWLAARRGRWQFKQHQIRVFLVSAAWILSGIAGMALTLWLSFRF